MLELLLVVIILGIIAAVLVPRVQAPTQAARDNVQAHQIRELNNAVNLYYNNEGSWPSALADLVPDYMPDGVPVSPNGGAYSLNSTSNLVEHTP